MQNKLGSLANSSIWGNLLTLALAISQKASIVDIIFILWLQYIFIGIISIIYILKVKNYSMVGDNDPNDRNLTDNQKRSKVFKIAIIVFVIVNIIFTFIFYIFYNGIHFQNLHFEVLNIIIWLIQYILIFINRNNSNKGKKVIILSHLGLVLFEGIILVIPTFLLMFTAISMQNNLTMVIAFFIVKTIFEYMLLENIDNYWFEK